MSDLSDERLADLVGHLDSAEPGEVQDMAAEIRRRRTADPSNSDRAALATAAHELKERRNNYAAMLARCTTATDEFVVTAYREGIAACEAAIAAVERLGGKR